MTARASSDLDLSLSLSLSLSLDKFRSRFSRRRIVARGFTIVELLIVIVVIAILAAVTVVAYNGIQQRANNATVVAAVIEYEKALKEFAIDHGSLYLINSTGVGLPGSGWCLGQDSNYPATSTVNNDAGQCGWMGSLTITVQPQLSQNLFPYLGGSDLSFQAIQHPYQQLRGIFFAVFTNGTGQLMYTIYKIDTCLPGFTSVVTMGNARLCSSSFDKYGAVTPS